MKYELSYLTVFVGYVCNGLAHKRCIQNSNVISEAYYLMPKFIHYITQPYYPITTHAVHKKTMNSAVLKGESRKLTSLTLLSGLLAKEPE